MDDLLHILLFSMPSIIYFFARRPVINNYKIRKDFKLKGVSTSVLPTEVLRKVNDIDEKRFLEQQFSDSIIEFIDVIKQNIPDTDLKIFYNNFNNIKTKNKNFKISNLIFDKSTGAQWLPDENIICVSSDNYKSTINHELLHASTTYIDPNTNTIFCGFQKNKSSNNQIGEGLNEGYTEYLIEKYFSVLYQAYTYEKSIAKSVELIVGEQKMQSLYFNANLKELIDILKQYSTAEKALDFITTLDFLNNHLRDKNLTSYSKNIILNSLKSINHFLIQTYIKKVIMESPNGKTNSKEVLEKLIPLLTIIPFILKKDGKSIIVNDDKEIIEVIDETFSYYKFSEDRKTILK